MGERFIILAWHSIRVLENSYAENDPMAFSEDLATLDRLGWTIVPLATALSGMRAGTLPQKTAVLTADDGAILDFLPFDHPTCGPQQPLAARLAAFRDELPGDTRHRPHLSSFVIASPEARAELDRSDFHNLGVWPDHWWHAATVGGLVSIENHSWDHNHASLARTAQRDNRRGDFHTIETEAECRLEIDRASDYIEQHAGRRPRFFAYPYGHAGEYLRTEYLPRHGPRLGLEAALGCYPGPVTPQSDRWHLPRFMFEDDWNRPGELEKLLADCQ